MKKFLYSVLLLATGVLVGIVLTSYLSMLASKSFMKIIRLNYQTEEHIKAIKAKKNSDMKEAIIHYRNLVEVSSSPGLYCFPDGHLKIPHLWPGQNPPPRWSAERV
jgi:hypothetical protein